MSVDLTVSEAAELLNVGEGFVLGQLKVGAPPFHIVEWTTSAAATRGAGAS
jgi:hypothetical protein